MSKNFVDFERPIFELEAKIDALQNVSHENDVNLNEDITRLKEKSRQLTASLFSSLTPHQVLKIARHPDRPYTHDYIQGLFTDFDELQGDRFTSSGSAIIGGIARFDKQPILVIGHQKGRGTKQKIHHNFGMPRPDEYRKALRLFRLAEQFHLPVISFIDTPGAYPGIKAERHNQSQAIANNLKVLSQLRVPIICIVIGEGGSGGALAIGVGDQVLMLQYSVYSVISPEGCAAILWKDATRASEAAQAMAITAPHIKALNLIDDIVPEPLGGAHRDVAQMMQNLKEVLRHKLAQVMHYECDELLNVRYQRLMSYGALQSDVT